MNSLRTIFFIFGAALLIQSYSGLKGALLRYKGGYFPEKFPKVLSITGFTGAKADGFIPYSVNVPVWKNRTLTKRWVSVPRDSVITWDSTNQYVFPIGTAFVLSLSSIISVEGLIEEIKVETQFLIKDPEGNWQAFSYVWRLDQTDADLVPPFTAFKEPPLTLPIEENGAIYSQDWWPNTSRDCQLCHLPEVKPLGFVTPQLWRPETGVPNSNQTARLVSENVLSVVPDSAVLTSKNIILKWTGPEDSSESLTHRAASYLAVNCGSCHYPGNPQISQPSFRYFNASDMDSLIADGHKGGIILFPGKPDSAHILTRMIAKEMPQLPSVLPDFKGIHLLWDWINQLGGTNVPKPELSLSSYLRPHLSTVPHMVEHPGFFLNGRQIVTNLHNEEILLFSLSGNPIKIHRLNSRTSLIPESLSSGVYVIKSGGISRLLMYRN